MLEWKEYKHKWRQQQQQKPDFDIHNLAQFHNHSHYSENIYLYTYVKWMCLHISNSALIYALM